jgi:membrane protein implicated in regulation of membrane protease activity
MTSSIRKPGLFYFKFDSPFFKRYRIGMHILFWLSYLIYEGLIWGMVDGKYADRLTSTAIELPVKISATYFTLYVLIDRLLIKRHYVGFLLGLALSMLSFGVVLRMLAYYIIYPIFYTDGTAVPLFFPPKILIAIFSIYSIVGIVACFHLIKHWHNHQQASQQLEKDKLESELSILKSQINPHFLFNTLNSLYVLTMNQSGSAPEIVHKLSELMSYMLYDSNQNEVPLQKELHYIENYIGLEKLRYESRLDISLHVYSPVEGITIAPLIILPFVENCFKHGVSHQVDDSWIRIDISMQQSMLVLKIENSLNTDGIQATRKISGIGLQNVKKRLELIYPQRYHLQLLNEEESFLVILKLELDKTRVLGTEDIAHPTALMHEMPDRR